MNIAEKSGILKELKSDSSSEGISRFDNVQELLNGLREFSSNAREEGNPGKLENFMEEVALLTDQDDEKDEDRDKVTLMTIHSAKGLEFKNVFVVGLEENLFPSSQIGDQRSPEAMEEERRLFYVALTRAMENAWFTWATQRYKWGKPDFCSPSRFLLEMDEKYLEEVNSAESREKTGNETARPEKPGDWFSLNSTRYSPAAPKTGREITGNFRAADKYLSDRNKDDAFKGDDPEKILEGMTVEHQRFGRGKVLKVENYGTERRAIVFFSNAGQKQLLLKFARLKILE
jgi:DNA helicase-2/ATP-dependent DNA helicase PcrA